MRQDHHSLVQAFLIFQSTHPRGMRPFGRFASLIFMLFQSTHPRGMRQKHGLFTKHLPEISIHASTRDATLWTICITHLHAISIHASTRDATKARLVYKTFARNFNPRIHEGCDQCHPPRYLDELDFNPRIHEGCDFY